MLAKRPEDRYQQAAQLASELEAWRNPGTTAAFTGLTSAQQDSKLEDFLRSVGGPKPPNSPSGASAASVKSSTKQTATDVPEQTAALSQVEVGTDPKSEILLSPVTKTKQSGDRGKKPPSKLITAGAAGLLLLLLGSIVALRKDGPPSRRRDSTRPSSPAGRRRSERNTAAGSLDTS